jgi:hypothetical protein
MSDHGVAGRDSVVSPAVRIGQVAKLLAVFSLLASDRTIADDAVGDAFLPR